jgi:alkylation response protein AidB-like acyl-CoA dehydrogenase
VLPGIAEGRTRAAVAWDGAVEAAREGDSWLLTGTANHVLDGDDADLYVVPARVPEGDGRTSLFVAAASAATVDLLETVDPGRPQARAEFLRSPARVLSAEAPLDRILDLACVAVSAEQVGAAQRAFDLTLAYAKQRVQFGRPIGSFQAVKHRLADMFTLLESARSASYAAAFAAVSGYELTVAASRAKAYCSEAFSAIAGEAIQLHGGIGITWEHPIHRYFKRAHTTSQLFGTPAWHRRRYARAVGLAA